MWTHRLQIPYDWYCSNYPQLSIYRSIAISVQISFWNHLSCTTHSRLCLLPQSTIYSRKTMKRRKNSERSTIKCQVEYLYMRGEVLNTRTLLTLALYHISYSIWLPVGKGVPWTPNRQPDCIYTSQSTGQRSYNFCRVIVRTPQPILHSKSTFK